MERARKKSEWLIFSLGNWWVTRQPRGEKWVKLGASQVNSDPVEFELLGVTTWPGAISQADDVSSSHLPAFPF